MCETTETKRRFRKWWIAGAVAGGVVIVIAALAIAWATLVRPEFEPDRVARAETLMWKAYYAEDKTRLGVQLIAFLRNQYGLSAVEAKRVGELLASSAIKFRKARRGQYEAAALPDLTKAFRLVQEATDKPFDPEALARAELAWWVARRTPGEKTPEQVGEKMALTYALYYGGEHPAFVKAGVLRAQAAQLRYSQKTAPDWERVEALLCESYRELQRGKDAVAAVRAM